MENEEQLESAKPALDTPTIKDRDFMELGSVSKDTKGQWLGDFYDGLSGRFGF